jgi:hypothetical protein
MTLLLTRNLKDKSSRCGYVINMKAAIYLQCRSIMSNARYGLSMLIGSRGRRSPVRPIDALRDHFDNRNSSSSRVETSKRNVREFRAAIYEEKYAKSTRIRERGSVERINVAMVNQSRVFPPRRVQNSEISRSSARPLARLRPSLAMLRAAKLKNDAIANSRVRG